MRRIHARFSLGRHDERPGQRSRWTAGLGVLALVLLLALLLSVATAPSSGAVDSERGQETTERESGAGPPGGVVDVVEVSGLLDPVLVDFVDQAVGRAEREGAVALVLQLNSSGAVVDDEDLIALARRLRDSEVPVAVWIGTSGARATGAAAQLAGVVETRGMAPGTRLGDMGEQILPPDEFGVLFGDQHDRLVAQTVGSEEAFELGIVTDFATEAPTEEDADVEVVPGAPTVGDFIVNLDGVETEEITVDDQVRRQPVTTVRLSALNIVDQLAHTVASPNVAYLLLVIGLGLLVFELYTAGVGIAGVIGAGCVVASCYGLWILPVRWWAVAVLVFAFFGFAVDVQAGVPRVWTGIGFVALLIGSVFLYDGLALSWVTLVAALGGAALTFFTGMPAMVRTRFGTPTIGREWMIGEEGEAVVAVDPDGTVRVRDALWRASTHRHTPIGVGDPVRVVAIDGLTLEVEPPEGGARDYREWRKGGE